MTNQDIKELRKALQQVQQTISLFKSIKECNEPMTKSVYEEYHLSIKNIKDIRHLIDKLENETLFRSPQY